MINKKLWFLNIMFMCVIITGVVLLTTQDNDHELIYSIMIGIPMTAYAAEMNIYAHKLAKKGGL